MVVASLVAGRVRIRDNELKKAQQAQRVREELLGTPGVSSVEANPRVGSLLVLYDEALAALEKILKAVSEILDSEVDMGESAVPLHGESEGGEPARGFWRRTLQRGKVTPVEPSILKRRILSNIGMLSSLLVSVVAALFDLKKLHILSGVLFLLLFGEHFYQRRARMFA